MKKIVLFWFILYSCSSEQDKLHVESKKYICDTIFAGNQLIVNCINAPLGDTSLILQTTCLLINDDKTALQEYNSTKHIEADSSINFMNAENDMGIKHFHLINDTLFCDLFFLTSGDKFFTGSIRKKIKDTLILKLGKAIKSQLSGPPIVAKLSFKIYCPNNLKLNKLLFRAEEDLYQN